MNSPFQHIDLGALRPEARRLIAIYPDSEVATRRSDAAGSAQTLTKRNVARFVSKAVFGPLLSIPLDRAIDALSDKAAGLDVVYTTSREVEQAGFILPKYRQLRTLYVMHPMDSNQYFPAASFHRQVLEHKFAEAVALLVALGATNIVVEHEHGWSREVVAKVDVPVPEEQATIGITAKGSKGLHSKILFEASYKGGVTPQVPSGLVWYPQERTWQTIAQGRIEGGMDRFALTLSYNEDFGINIDFVAKAQDMSIELGGKFESHEATQWTIRGEFGRARARKVP